MKKLIILAIVWVGLVVPASLQAANISITGGSNGATCNSGGYFSPSSISAHAGDTISIMVPASDPYPGGLDVLGFPQGTIHVARGGMATTASLSAGTISFHGTWPSTPSCVKGSGMVTVASAAPAPSPASNPTPTPAQTSPNNSAAKPSTSMAPQPSQTASPSMTPTTGPSATNSSNPSPSAATASTATKPKTSRLPIAGATGEVGLAVIVIMGLIYYISRRRAHQH